MPVKAPLKTVCGVFGWMTLVSMISCTTYETVPPRVEARAAPKAPRSEGSSTPGGETAKKTPAPRRKLSPGWVGTYDYIEKGPAIGGINTMVGYSLVVRPDGSARYSANGYQTDTIIECDVTEEGDELRLVARESLKNEAGEESFPTYPKGAVLFVLKRAGGKLTTTWKEVQPAFEGCASGSTCMQKEK